MRLHTSSYFAGVATVVVTMALGFGGGVLLTDAFIGKSENPPTLAERRAAPLAEATTNTAAAASPSEIAPQIAASPQPAAPSQTAQAPPVVATPSPPPAPAPQQQQHLTEAAAIPAPVNAPPVAVQAPAPSLAQPSPARQIDQAMARARDDEVRKAQAAERRKVERRKWAERRKQETRKLEELDAMSEKVREIEREPEPVRSFFAQSPRIRLFDDD
jgi:hypothetical protein